MTDDIRLKIKPTSGGEVFSVTCGLSATVLELKEEVGKANEAPVSNIRLIYRGQILKDASTVESYGLNNDHVVHMVKSKPPPAPSPSSTAPASSPAAAASVRAPGSGGGGGSDPLVQQLNALGMGGPHPEAQAASMRSAMSSPWFQAMASNPEFMRSMIQSNPALRQMTEANPQVAAMLNDPETMREMMRVMENPNLMREYTRNMDRSLANIESMPGGFNALRQVHEQIQEPLNRAADEAAEGDGGAAGAAANPFASLFQQAAAGSAGEEGAAGGGAPNEAPLPNPWAAPGGGAAGAGAAGFPDLAALGLGGLGGLGGMGGFPMPGAGGGPSPDMSTMLNSPEMQAATAAMLRDPATRSMVASQMRAMMESDPTMQEAAAANPGMRQMLENPAMMESVMSLMANPDNMRAMQQMSQAAVQLQGSGLGGLFGAGGVPGPGGAVGGAGAGGLDMSALLGMGGGAAAPPADPEVAYASQLQQLQDMGFFDRESNIRALLATGGNVHAAVDRLLSSV